VANSGMFQRIGKKALERENAFANIAQPMPKEYSRRRLQEAVGGLSGRTPEI